MSEDKFRKAMKSFVLAGMDPSTPEEINAYQIGLRIMKELESEKPVFGGYIGKRKTKKEKVLDKIKYIKGEIQNRKPIVDIPWDKFYKKVNHDLTTYKITPTKSIRNNEAYVLAKVIASFYRKPSELRSYFKNGSLIHARSPYMCNFRIVMKPDDISFYLLIPTEKAPEILRKVESIYDRGITIEEVKEGLPKLDPEKVFCTELNYRKHDIFSLDTNRGNNYPLPSLLTAVRTLEGDDVAIFDALFEPNNRTEWFKESKEAHNLLEKGYVPNNNTANKVLRAVHSGISKLRYEILELTRFTKEQKRQLKEMIKEEASYKEAARIRSEMTNATKRKQDEDTLLTWMRIAVQSDVPARARDAAYTISNAWKDISSDNELERTDVPAKWNKKYLEAIETSKGFSIRFKENKFSVEEAGKILQLPGDSLISEFSQIKANKVQEVSIPEELTIEKVPGVRIGTVTERGVKKIAKIPLNAFSTDKLNVKLMEVYDAVCTSSFGQGKQGSGKTDGYGTTWAYDMVTNGFTAIIIDTADGQVLRKFVDSLPEDYPDEKIHILNFDNKAYPPPADWSDIYGRDFSGSGKDEDLALLEISERITSRFISFINSLSNTGEFSDRMQQYVSSCMRAITMRPGWSFLDLELALTCPSYREELMELPALQNEPDILADLEDLQEKAAAGKDGTIVDNIMNRLKVLSSTTFMANLFLQPPKLDENRKPILDMRKLMDNEEGGYGHTIIIQASGIWDDNQATILGFMEDKINFNAFSRIDIPQEERKPVLKWIDEPHKVIKRLEDRLAGTAVEFRKYRVKNLFTGHSIDQMGKAAKSLLDGGAQITSYKTESLADLKRFSHTFAPYSDAEELYNALPDKWRAVNKVRLPSGSDCPAFIADMTPPPQKVKDRSYIWHECAQKYGRPWKEVKSYIQDTRSKYRELDKKWLYDQEVKAAEEKAMKKELEKQMKKAVSKE